MPEGLTAWRDALLSQGGIVLFCLFILRAGYRQKWRWDREVIALEKALDAMTTDRDLWRDRCLESYEDARKIAAHVALALKDGRV